MQYTYSIANFTQGVRRDTKSPVLVQYSKIYIQYNTVPQTKPNSFTSSLRHITQIRSSFTEEVPLMRGYHSRYLLAICYLIFLPFRL